MVAQSVAIAPPGGSFEGRELGEPLGEGSGAIEGLYNLQMEPSRLTVGAIMRPRRAAHLAR